MYKYKASASKGTARKAHLFGSGAILNESLKAQEILEEKYDVAADVWSVTSYKSLYTDAISTDRENLLNPARKPKVPFIGRQLAGEKGVFVAASDYIKALPASVAKWVPGRFVILGTDGYGRSDSRPALRNFFEVDARYITLATLHALAQDGVIGGQVVIKAAKDLDIDPGKADPLTS
jgi:pyruvate dehydrogenase E1 component